MRWRSPKAIQVMQLNFEHRGRRYQCATEDAKSIAIELNFDGKQPNYFGVPKASATVLKLDGFVGRTAQGGSCNVQDLKINPHCNGTHTETVGHIVDDAVPIGRAAISPVVVALLVTVTPRAGGETDEVYRPDLEASDLVIDSKQLLQAVARVADVKELCPEALIVRTMPNHVDKCWQAYPETNAAPFFTVEAIEAINSLGIEHLLTDLPSIDRSNDDGLLTNHHLFWSVPEATHALTKSTQQNKTITEMLYVDDEIADGIFGLSIQVPAFTIDAAPSRPIIMRLKSVK